MRAWINVPASAAVLAGKSASGILPVELDEAFLSDLPPRLREVLASSPGLGSPEAPPNTWRVLPGVEATPKAVHLALVAEADIREKEAAERAAEAEADRARKAAQAANVEASRTRAIAALEAEAREWLARPDGDFIGVIVSDGRVRLSGNPAAPSKVGLDAYTPYPEPATRADLPADLQSALEAREAAAKVLREAAGKALDAARHDSIAQAIPEEHRARFAEGFVSEAEGLGWLRAQVFAPLDPFARYSRLVADDVEHDETCEGPTICFSTVDPEGLTPGQFALLAKLRDAAPQGAAVTPREHRAWCDAHGCDDSDQVSRRSALVTVTVGGWALSREYALGV